MRLLKLGLRGPNLMAQFRLRGEMTVAESGANGKPARGRSTAPAGWIGPLPLAASGRDGYNGT
jgi:hypothetical protein